MQTFISKNSVCKNDTHIYYDYSVHGIILLHNNQSYEYNTSYKLYTKLFKHRLI